MFKNMEQRKKILVFHSYLAPYRIDLYNALARDFDVYVLLTAGDAEKKTLGFDLNFVNEQATFKYTYVNKGVYIGRHIISSIFYKVIRDFRPDYVIAHELGLNTFMAIVLKSRYNYKLFVTVDDSYLIAQNYSISRKMLRGIVVKYSDIILTVSQDVRSYLDKKYTTKKSASAKFLYFPIIQDELLLERKFQKGKERSDDLLKIHRLEGKKIILFVGRLEDVKSPDLLLKAYSEISNETNQLVFVGEGSLSAHLKQWVKKHELDSRVIFTGRLTGDDLYAWYTIANIFVLPSRFEPFGAVVNEALVAGCFVIVSDSAGASSLIDDTNGLVFKTNDRVQLTAYLQKALDESNDLSKHDRVNKMNVSFKEMYNELIENLNHEN